MECFLEKTLDIIKGNVNLRSIYLHIVGVNVRQNQYLKS